jgi:hypothetical protein
MKKTLLFLIAVCFTLTLTMSSCTKERMALNLLYGTWKLDSRLDNNGVAEPLGFGILSQEELLTFYRCSDKENEACTGSSKTTTVTSFGSSINPGTFNYRVFKKTQIIIDNTYYEIDELKKKSFVVHPVNEPLAKETYSKQ